MVTEVPDRPQGLAIGDNLIVITPGGEEEFFEIINRDTIFFRDTPSAVSSGSTQSFTEVTALNPPVNQIYQFHSILIDGNIKLVMKQPAATNRWGTNRSPEGGLLTDRLSPLSSGELLNFWVIENIPPSRQMSNDTNVSITPILWWFGWRYSVKRLKDKPKPATIISATGIAR